MSVGSSPEMLTEAMASIEDIASRIEDTFAEVGSRLGRGHAMFQDLNGGLALLSQELSGTKIDGASVALRDIASKLNQLAEALPSESTLLGAISGNSIEAAALLKALVKQIQMITIIARSARIEAASLDENRGNFLDFTREVFDLAKSVQISIEACAGEQERLSEAIAVALSRQREFERDYHAQLISVGAELASAHATMRDRQAESVQLADVARQSTEQIATAVGRSIVSLQAGDSTRQRLEHVGRGLRMAVGAKAGLSPAPTDEIDAVALAAPLICRLQAAQLRDALSEFDADVSEIARSFTTLTSAASGVVDQGGALYRGQEGDMTSFLAGMKRSLAHASALIVACEAARKSVDAALSVVEDKLGNFRSAISGLSEAVVDINLIGMNAGLKAGQLGVKGRAFVVIAHELKITADHISGGARTLRPVLDDIERSAHDLKHLRADGDSTRIATLEPAILQAIRQIETGNEQLSQLMDRLGRENLEFDDLMTSATSLLRSVKETSTTLPPVVTRLDAGGAAAPGLSADAARCVQPLFDELYAQYTMAGEREVHVKLLQRLGLVDETSSLQAPQRADETDDVLFF